MKASHLVVFVDALGTRELSLLTKAGLSLPHQSSLTGVLGYSSGALPTILTGRSPAAHGRMCLFSRWQGQGPSPLWPLSMLGLLPRVLHERGWLRGVAGRAFAAAASLTGYVALHRVPPFAMGAMDLPERDDMFEADDIAGHRTFLSIARERGMSVVAPSWKLPESQRVDALASASDVDLGFLYLTGLDAILHRTGDPDEAAQAWMKQAVSSIDRVRLSMSSGGRKLTTTVIGDHGMAAVHGHVDARPTVEAIRKHDPDAWIFVDSTMLRVSVRESARDIVAGILSRLPGQLLASDEQRRARVPHDGRYGDLITVLREGLIFVPSYVGGAAKGMHGYARSSASARAGIASDLPLDGLRDLEDIGQRLTRACMEAA